MKHFIHVVIIFGLVFLGACASQEDVTILNNRLIDMEDQVNQLEAALSNKLEAVDKTSEEKELALRSQSADIRATVNQLRSEIQQINGRLEAIEFQLGKNDDGSKVISSMNKDRIEKIEEYLGLESQTQPAQVSPSEETSNTENVEDGLYQLAKALYDQDEYVKAREKFIEFLKKYPKSKNCDNAQFWIGETYFREKWYEKAILEYQKVIEQYPTGNKVAAALLKQGLGFKKLGEETNAMHILKELIRRFPSSPEAKIAEKSL